MVFNIDKSCHFGSERLTKSLACLIGNTVH